MGRIYFNIEIRWRNGDSYSKSLYVRRLSLGEVNFDGGFGYLIREEEKYIYRNNYIKVSTQEDSFCGK